VGLSQGRCCHKSEPGLVVPGLARRRGNLSCESRGGGSACGSAETRTCLCPALDNSSEIWAAGAYKLAAVVKLKAFPLGAVRAHAAAWGRCGQGRQGRGMCAWVPCGNSEAPSGGAVPRHSRVKAALRRGG
jgi:hypothetical protein